MRKSERHTPMHRDPEGPVVLDPVVRRLVDASATPPHLHELGPADGRQALRESQSSRVEDAGVETTFHVAHVGPTGLVGFWIFRPPGVPERSPFVFYLHGGRWMLGDAHTHARLIGELACGGMVTAVVPEYSRTPEARHPVQIEECHALLAWTVEHAERLGLDADRVAVAGDCAGATLATALALLAKERGGPGIRAQLLYYPLTDARCSTRSQRRFATGHLLTRAALRRYWRIYAGTAELLDEPMVSPLRASRSQLSGLPPALVVTAEADVARDEAEEYAERLRGSGVDVTAVRFQGTVHDFVSLESLRDSAPTRAATGMGANHLRKYLNGGRATRAVGPSADRSTD
ncbi:alpha/beta hydrolase [Streptomyces sp. NPDC056323]|uniref:alpha/beta hydrolase n=1 Tax=Streptomyces sp. NPDC056323 TaxID=3345784 RepID=UPI0035DDDDCA